MCRCSCCCCCCCCYRIASRLLGTIACSQSFFPTLSGLLPLLFLFMWNYYPFAYSNKKWGHFSFVVVVVVVVVVFFFFLDDRKRWLLPTDDPLFPPSHRLPICQPPISPGCWFAVRLFFLYSFLSFFLSLFLSLTVGGTMASFRFFNSLFVGWCVRSFLLLLLFLLLLGFFLSFFLSYSHGSWTRAHL